MTRTPLRNMLPSTVFTARRAAHTSAPVDVSQLIRRRHGAALTVLRTVIRHPRSLARPLDSWQAPQVTLPATGYTPELVVEIARQRVGRSTRLALRDAHDHSSHHRDAAYLVTATFRTPEDAPIKDRDVEAWLRALIPGADASAVHDVSDSTTARTFCWVVDTLYCPLESPAELFSYGLSA